MTGFAPDYLIDGAEEWSAEPEKVKNWKFQNSRSLIPHVELELEIKCENPVS